MNIVSTLVDKLVVWIELPPFERGEEIHHVSQHRV
jgi:hypothetical protein